MLSNSEMYNSLLLYSIKNDTRLQTIIQWMQSIAIGPAFIYGSTVSKYLAYGLCSGVRIRDILSTSIDISFSQLKSSRASTLSWWKYSAKNQTGITEYFGNLPYQSYDIDTIVHIHPIGWGLQNSHSPTSALSQILELAPYSTQSGCIVIQPNHNPYYLFTDNNTFRQHSVSVHNQNTAQAFAAKNNLSILQRQVQIARQHHFQSS